MKEETTQSLSQAVERFAASTQALSDAELARAWAWRYHTDEGLRFAFLGTYHELRDLAATTAETRARSGSPPTLAQRVLAQYQLAYRDLQALLLGVSDDAGVRVPAEGEWPLVRVLTHMIGTERIFWALINFALTHPRPADDQPLPELDETWAASFFGEDMAAFETLKQATLSDIRSYYDAMHERVLHALVQLSDQELDAPSLWWEEQPIPVRFRMHRFDAHMRQHSIQVEKTLDMIGCPPSEAKRLLRHVYAALAEVEGAALGSDLDNSPAWHELAATISARAAAIGDGVTG